MTASTHTLWRRSLQSGLCVVCLGLAAPLFGAPVTLLSTQFEDSEGYYTDFDLAGQNGWTYAGFGGNGILPDYPPYGQSAYIGFDPPTVDGLAVWKPLTNNSATHPIVTAMLDMWVIDSTTNRPNRDEFSWEVYNVEGVRLFALIFDNRDLKIYHQLDDDLYGTYSGHTFTNDGLYALKIQMNFQANHWNAWLNSEQVITNKLITVTNAALTFGDVDAVWLRGSTNGAGDNFMIFDNLAITADALTLPASVVQPPVAASGGSFLIRVDGAEGEHYAVEASTNLKTWTALKTNVISDGYFDFWDTSAAGIPQRFYRARWVP